MKIYKKREEMKRNSAEEKQKRAIQKRKAAKRNMKIGAVLAAVLVIGVLIFTMAIYPNMPTNELYTPQIVGNYSGYFTHGGAEGNGTVSITSCDASGNVEGYFEFTIDDAYGKCALTGSISEKKNNGNVTMTLIPGEWLAQSGGLSALGIMTVEITDDATSFACKEYSMNWSTGAGSGASVIETVEDLKQLQNSSDTYQLVNDIDLGGQNFTPISGFTGTLRGNGYTIKNLTIESSASNVGFFSKLEGKVINLNFENANITVSGRNENIGILCGEFAGSVSNVTVNGTVTAEKSSNVGGAIGYAGSTKSYTLSHIKNYATVTGLASVGGICGKLLAMLPNATDSFDLSVSNLENFGSVRSIEDYAAGIVAYTDLQTSGYVGDVTLNIFDCRNEGMIEGNYYVGGIVGYGNTVRDGQISDCTNASAIRAKAYVGCIAGATNCWVLKDCSNEGSSLFASGSYIENGKKYAYVGGLVGKGTCLENCTNYIDITYTGGGDYVGGVMGFAVMDNTAVTGDYLGSSGAQAYYKNIKNLGNISGAGYVGGVVGGFDFYWQNGCKETVITFEQFINEGNVTATDDYVGGVGGFVKGYVGGLGGALSFSIFDCENTGNVTGANNVGGIFGCLHSEQRASTVSGCISSGAVVGQSNTDTLIGLDQTRK